MCFIPNQGHSKNLLYKSIDPIHIFTSCPSNVSLSILVQDPMKEHALDLVVISFHVLLSGITPQSFPVIHVLTSLVFRRINCKLNALIFPHDETQVVITWQIYHRNYTVILSVCHIKGHIMLTSPITLIMWSC